MTGTKSSNASPSANPPQGAIRLRVVGMNIPAFKNQKRAIYDQRKGQYRTLTHGSVAKQMESIIQSFVSQLSSTFQTTDGVTLMGRQLPSLIVSWLPEDDSWQWIPEQNYKAQRVPRGSEGCDVLIEVIEPPQTKE